MTQSSTCPGSLVANVSMPPDVLLSFAQFEREVTGERPAHVPQIRIWY